VIDTKITCTTQSEATHILLTFALLKDGKPDMAEQEQQYQTKGNVICPLGWVIVCSQPVTLSGKMPPLYQWLDRTRDAREAARTAKLEEEAAHQFQAKLAADAEREAAEAKRLADIEAQKPKEVEP